MILIIVKFKTKPGWSEWWLDLVDHFTRATRAEPGNLWFEWSRSVQDRDEFILVEAFEDDAAEAHVRSDHFEQAMKDMPKALAKTPLIINTKNRAVRTTRCARRRCRGAMRNLGVSEPRAGSGQTLPDWSRIAPGVRRLQ
ncbi:MAG TPA: putative quinol monooxygenase [Acidimicrobiales bacterium]